MDAKWCIGLKERESDWGYLRCCVKIKGEYCESDRKELAMTRKQLADESSLLVYSSFRPGVLPGVSERSTSLTKGTK